jgi:hypothetical protein
MLRKTLVTLTAITVLGLGSAAMAGHGGGGGGGGGVVAVASEVAVALRAPRMVLGGGGGGFAGGGWHGGGPGLMMRGSVGPVTRGGPMTTAPINGAYNGWQWVYVCGDYGYY